MIPASIVVVRLDPMDYVTELTDIGMRQLPYATALALNSVGFDFQAAQREGLNQRFTLRRKRFVEQGIYFPRDQRADYRRGQMSATVSVEPRRDFLTKFERGGWKQPRSSSRLSVPAEARRVKSGIVSKSERIGSLQLRLYARGPNATVGRGLKRTWSIRYPDGRGYIFRRTGRGKRSTLRLLYIFRPRVPIPASLEFHETAEATARARFHSAFADGFERALRTAR